MPDSVLLLADLGCQVILDITLTKGIGDLEDG